MILAALLILLAAMPVDLDSHWDWDDPVASEKKFRELPESPEVQTQIARAQALQRKFDEAHKTLDGVVTNSPCVEVRYLLERGRVFNSSGKPDQARPLFLAAWEKAQTAKLDYFAVDAAQMLGILEPPDEGLRWNEKAIALAEKSSDPKAHKWLGTLLNKIGWAYYNKHEYAKAIDAFQRDIRWFDEQELYERVRIARYSIGKTYRAMGRYEEALALQQKLTPDGYVNEEIGECLLALGRPEEAKSYFARAYELLSKNEWLVANEPQRLQRMRDLSR